MIRLPGGNSPRVWLLFSLFVSFGGSAAAQPRYLGSNPKPDSKKPVSYPDVDGKLQTAWSELSAAQEALGRKDRGDAKKRLEKAEVSLEQALKANPASRSSAELLGTVYFYQGEAGDKSAWERAAKFLKDVLDKEPDSFQAARYLAWSYAKLGKSKETVAYASQAAALSPDTAVSREMNDLKRPFQEAFLSNWYEYEKYYESSASKLTQFNPQTYKLDVVLQVTPQFEQELAAKGLQALTPSLKISGDAELQKYLQNLVDKLLAKTPKGPPFTYKVDVVESPQVNAIAFPGRILVNTGLLKFTESEAELVTILSHELAHIYAHHGARALVASSQKRIIAGQLLAAAGVNNSNLKEQLLTLGVGIGLELLDKGYSRQEEKEADKYGTHIAFNAGYNPSFMTKFFLRLYEANPKQPFRLLSTHPPTNERIEYTARYLEGFPLETEMQIDSQEFKDIKRRIR